MASPSNNPKFFQGVRYVQPLPEHAPYTLSVKRLLEPMWFWNISPQFASVEARKTATDSGQTEDGYWRENGRRSERSGSMMLQYAAYLHVSPRPQGQVV